MSEHIAIDFECFYSTKLKYGLRQMIAEEYCQHELFDCYLVSVTDGVKVWAGSPKELNWDALHGKVLVSHNRYFDNTVWNELKRQGVIPSHVQFQAWHCTANLTSYLCNRRALKDAVEHLYKIQISKDYRNIADNRNWPQDYTEEQRAQIVAAGTQDAQWCWKLWKDYAEKWPAVEQKLSNITIDQGMFGVQIDAALLNDYILWTHDLKMTTEKLIPWMQDNESEDWDDFNPRPTSTKCIAEQCRRKGIPCPPIKTEDEEGYEEWETQYAPAHPWIRCVTAWRSIAKLYSTFLTVKRRLRPDGTMPFAIKYFGAHTGRWSGDAKINFQNMRKKPLFVNEHGLMEADEKKIFMAMEQHDDTGCWAAWVRHAIDFRALIRPRPGKKMISCDLSQIEPRVLAWLSGNKKLLCEIESGYGVYIAFARTSMGYTQDTIDKRSDYYKMVKIQVLGLGYGAGWEKFIGICWNEGGIDITKDDPEFVTVEDPFTHEQKQVSGYGTTSKKIVKKFRDSVPHITALWKQMDDAFKRSVAQDFNITLPSGRVMHYNQVRVSSTISKDKETGKPKRETKFTADVGGKRKYFYGGKLVENITQATARDVFAHQLVFMWEKGWRVLFGVHDEAVLEVDPAVSARDIEAEMSVCPVWLQGCPIAAEAKEIQHYCK